MVSGYISFLKEGITDPIEFLKKRKTLWVYSARSYLLLVAANILHGFIEYNNGPIGYNSPIFSKGLTFFLIGGLFFSTFLLFVMGFIIKLVSGIAREKIAFIIVVQVVILYSIAEVCIDLFSSVLLFFELDNMAINFIVLLFSLAYFLFVYFVTLKIVVRKRLGLMQKIIPAIAYIALATVSALLV